MEDNSDELADIFCDSFFSGEQDHWLFDQPLIASADLVPLEIPLFQAKGSNEYDDFLSVCPQFIPLKCEQFHTPTTSNTFTNVENHMFRTETNEAYEIPKVESKIEITLPQESSELDVNPITLNVMEGLTEFIPWTGFDYTSDGDFDEEKDDDEDVIEKGGGVKKKRKRINQKQPSADADLIASATEENLRKLGIDPSSNEGKKQKRKIRNRLSAQLHRERKKGYISYLEGLVKERDFRLATVSIRLRNMHRENNNLRSKLGYTRTRDDSVDYSSAGASGGHTDSDTGEDSDTISESSDKHGTPSEQSLSPRRGMTIGTRFKGSKIGSSISLFSAVLMISITLFGPNIQNINPVNSDIISVNESPSQLNENLEITHGNGIMRSDADKSKQLMASHHGRRLSTSSALSQNLHEYVKQPERSDSTAPKVYSTDVTKSLVPTASQFVFHAKINLVSAKSQGLWHYNDHITDLYPRLVRYYNPEEELSGNYSEISRALQMRVRRNLRTRDDRNDSHVRTDDAHEHSKQVQRSYDTTEEENDENMGKTLVSVLPKLISRSQSPAPNHIGQPSIDYSTSTSSAKYSSMSRVLLTQGRALLDPSLVNSPQSPQKSTVIPTRETTGGETTASSLLKTMSTWTGRSDPPVVRVGVNSMGTSDAGSNMLVMLLPASAVRWGKNWGDSSEGTMEAMLNGLNFTDSTHDNNVGTGNPSSEEGMWVEIGCSVFRAQLVRNVTLSS